MFTTYKQAPRTRRLFREWERPEPKPQRRRSRARLGNVSRTARQEARALFLHKVVAAPRAAARLNGRLFLNIAVFGLLAWLGVWFFGSDTFYISRIEVTGNKRVSAETIVKASGLQGYNIFYLNPNKVVDQIKKAIPPIQHVQVQHSLPNRVDLKVVEEGSQLMWEIAGLYYWVDDDGTLQPVEEGCEALLIVKDTRASPPDRIESDALLAARQLTRLLPEVHLLEYSPDKGLRFTHQRGWDVYLGTGADMAHKVNVLRAMEVQYSGQAMQSPVRIDLRYQDGEYLHSSSNDGGGG
jgi:cell division septal protein FtsQ